uniref:Ternary complex factor MIP1 leucine-zipper domain-containing protein n=1 Tax=Aegilops tauschii subsp. strangulata TaxID=200361 RepID=A0A453B788_AEGTS
MHNFLGSNMFGFLIQSTYLSFMSCQPTEKLITDIAVLELEFICLEQHLRTLYRHSFYQQLCDTISA